MFPAGDLPNAPPSDVRSFALHPAGSPDYGRLGLSPLQSADCGAPTLGAVDWWSDRLPGVPPHAADPDARAGVWPAFDALDGSGGGPPRLPSLRKAVHGVCPCVTAQENGEVNYIWVTDLVIAG